MTARKAERPRWRRRWTRDVVELLARRPDLRPAAPIADALDEAVRWNA